MFGKTATAKNAYDSASAAKDEDYIVRKWETMSFK